MSLRSRLEWRLTRRRFMELGLMSTAGLFLKACVGDPTPAATIEPTTTAVPPTLTSAPPAATATTPAAASSTPVPPTATAQPVATIAQVLSPTPACGDDDEPTPEQTAGPFYTPNTPERTNLVEAGMAGTPLLLTGRVVDGNCQPLAGALLDFWHANDAGEYDNEGYNLRGHQFANEAGEYVLETLVPGLYPGRTRHIHVRVQPAKGAILTTQLYFAPDAELNAQDGIYDERLLVDEMGEVNGRRQVAFQFVV